MLPNATVWSAAKPDGTPQYKATLEARAYGLGRLAVLPDDVLIDLILPQVACCPKALFRFACASKAAAGAARQAAFGVLADKRGRLMSGVERSSLLGGAQGSRPPASFDPAQARGAEEFLTRLAYGASCALAARMAARRDWPKARQALEHAVAMRPSEVETHWRLGEVLQHMALWPAAATAYRACLGVDRSCFAALKGLAQVLREQGEDARAEHYFFRAHWIDEQDVVVCQALGELALQKGAWGNAKRLFSRVLRQHPDHADALCKQGEAYRLNGQPLEAKACFARVLTQRPGHAVALCGLGEVLLEANTIDEAIEHFVQALQAQPSFAPAQFGLGQARIAQGQWALGESLCTEALRACPLDAQMHWRIGQSFKRAGHWPRAHDAFCRAVQLRPHHIQALMSLAAVQNKLAQPAQAASCAAEAIGLLLRAQQTVPNAPWVLSSARLILGDALRLQNQMARAALCYAEALADFPARPHAWAHACLGQRDLAEGQLAAAEQRFVVAIGIDEKLAEAHVGLGQTLLAARQFERAQRPFRQAQALALPGHRCASLLGLGDALTGLGRFAEALCAFRQAADEAVTDVEAHFRLAQALEAQGHTEDAVASFEWVLVLRPSHPGALAALGRQTGLGVAKPSDA